MHYPNTRSNSFLIQLLDNKHHDRTKILNAVVLGICAQQLAVEVYVVSLKSRDLVVHLVKKKRPWPRRRSSPVIHKVDNIAIIEQLLIEINWKHLRTESMSIIIKICQGALNSYWSDWFLYLTYFQKKKKKKKYKNANAVNSVYYGKTQVRRKVETHCDVMGFQRLCQVALPHFIPFLAVRCRRYCWLLIHSAG